MSEHTPGPWTAVHTDIRHSMVLANTMLAQVYSTAFRDTPQKIANANLMAAAPDLLEALQCALALLDGELGSEWGERFQADWHTTTRAILKARGETP